MQYLFRNILVLWVCISSCGCMTRRLWHEDSYTERATARYTFSSYAVVKDDLLLVATNGQIFSNCVVPEWASRDPRHVQEWADMAEASRRTFINQQASRVLGRVKDCASHFYPDIAGLYDVSALEDGKEYRQIKWRSCPDFVGDERCFTKPPGNHMLWAWPNPEAAIPLKPAPPDPALQTVACGPFEVSGYVAVPRSGSWWSVPGKMLLTPFSLAFDVVIMPFYYGSFILWASTDRRAFM